MRTLITFLIVLCGYGMLYPQNDKAEKEDGKDFKAAPIEDQKDERRAKDREDKTGMQEVDSLSLEELMSVKVKIASKIEQSVEEAPSIVSVITGASARNSMRKRLSDELDDIPGFIVTHSSNGDRIPVVRGLHSPDGVLVMIDGVPVNDPIDGSFSFYDIPFSAVQKVEIIRGPGSALHGGYALAGAVNIITKAGKGASHAWEYDAYGGFLGGFDGAEGGAALSYGHDAGGWDVAASLGAHIDGGEGVKIGSDWTDFLNKSGASPHAALYVFPGNGPERREEYRIADGHLQFNRGGLNVTFFGAVRQIYPLLSYRLSTWYDDRYFREDQLYRIAAEYRLRVTDDITITPRAYATLTRRLTKGDVTGRFAWNNDPESPNRILYGTDEYWGDGMYERRLHHTTNEGGDIRLDWDRFLTPGNKLTLGTSFDYYLVFGIENSANFRSPTRNDAFKCEITFYDLSDTTFESTVVKDLTEIAPWISSRTRLSQAEWDTNIDRATVSVYAQDLWKPFGWLSAIFGIRYSRYSDFGTSWSPRAGLVLAQWGWHLKFLYGSAFMPPSFIQLYDQTVTQALGKVELKGNSRLDPTTIQTYELSIGHTRGKSLKAQISGFYSETDNEIALDESVKKWRNMMERKIWGAEAEVIFTYAGVLARNTLSWYRSQGVDQGAGADIYPRLKYTVSVNYFIRGYTIFTGGVLRGFSDREKSDTRGDIPTTFDLQAGVKYRLYEFLDVSLAVKNILDQDIRDATPAEYHVPGDIPRASRTIVLSADGKF